MAYHALGKQKESDAAWKELNERYRASALFSKATVDADCNQRNEMFEGLDRAYGVPRTPV
jgi:hypothetical protein